MRKRSALGAAGGAVSLSGIAAFLGTCCMTPWVVAVLGVSGAVTLARLAVWQPYLLAIAAAFMGFAIWSAYRAPAPAGGNACDLASRRRMRRWVWLAAALMVVLAAISVAPIFIDFT